MKPKSKSKSKSKSNKTLIFLFVFILLLQTLLPAVTSATQPLPTTPTPTTPPSQTDIFQTSNKLPAIPGVSELLQHFKADSASNESKLYLDVSGNINIRDEETAKAVISILERHSNTLKQYIEVANAPEPSALAKMLFKDKKVVAGNDVLYAEYLNIATTILQQAVTKAPPTTLTSHQDSLNAIKQLQEDYIKTSTPLLTEVSQAYQYPLTPLPANTPITRTNIEALDKYRKLLENSISLINITGGGIPATENNIPNSLRQDAASPSSPNTPNNPTPNNQPNPSPNAPPTTSPINIPTQAPPKSLEDYYNRQDYDLPLDSSEKIQQFLKDQSTNLEQRLNTYKLLINLYEFIGQKDVATDMDKNLADINNKLQELKSAAGLSSKPIDDLNNKLDIGQFDLEGIWDQTKADFTEDYTQLLAWTANFEPFITNIHDKKLKTSLNEQQVNLFNKYIGKRTIIYRVVGEEGAIGDAKINSKTLVRPISLAEFIEKSQTDQLVLTLKPTSPAASLTPNLTPNSSNPNSSPTNSSNPTTSNPNSSSPTNPTQPNAPSPTNNPDTPATDLINTNQISNPVTDPNNARQTDTNIQNNLQPRPTPSLTPSSDTAPNKPQLIDLSENSTTIIDISRDFTGPVYVSSGQKALNILDDFTIKPQTARNPLEEITENIKESTTRPIDIISAQHANMNYVVMMNTLQNNNYRTSALKEDLYRPLYTDFLGNILTESGYVVVPTASNYTYYMNAGKLPMFNAMFLNSYPAISDSEYGRIQVSPNDENKYVYIKTESGNVELQKVDKEGNYIGDTIRGVALLSKTILQNELAENTNIDFMDPLKFFIPTNNTFSDTEQKNGNENNTVFINDGLNLKKIKDGFELLLNLKHISGEGSGTDWEIITSANLPTIKDKNILGRYLLTQIAHTTINNQEYVTGTIPYEGLDNALRSNFNIRTIGEKMEALNAKIINSINQNMMFYTPKLRDLPLLKDYGSTISLIVVLLAIIAFAWFMFQYASGVFSREVTGVREILITVVALISVTVLIIGSLDLVVDLTYNLPSQLAFKDESPMYILDQMESGYRSAPTGFFDSTQTLPVSESSEMVLTKLNKQEVKEVREKVMPMKKTNLRVYLPSQDSKRIDVIGDKIYLDRNLLKIKIKDLMEISRVGDTTTQNILLLDPYYTGYGEIAYYSPYFNIMKTLSNNINTYNYNRGTSFSILQYRKGYTKTSGRVHEVLKSIAFISPENFTEYLRQRITHTHLNKVLNESGSYLNPELSNPISNRKPTIPNPTNPNSATNPNPSAPTNPDFPANTDDNSDTQANTPLPVGMSEAEFSQLSDSQRKELAELNYEKILNSDVEKGISEAELLDVKAYVQSQLGGDLKDWLGLKKVLLLDNTQNPFDRASWDKIRESRWFPDSANSADPEFNEEVLLKKIYAINANTKRFVLNNLIYNSKYISDESLIKIISLYAAMEFNKEFSSVVGEQLYPKYIEMKGIDNQFIFKTLFIKSSDLYKGQSIQLSKYIAEQSSWTGLALLTLFQVMLLLRYIIKSFLLLAILITIPFVLIYVYIQSQYKHTQYVKGTLLAGMIIAVLNILEIVLYKGIHTVTNQVGVTQALSLSMVSILPTLIYIYLISKIASDYRSFGYNSLTSLITNPNNQSYADYTPEYTSYDYPGNPYTTDLSNPQLSQLNYNAYSPPTTNTSDQSDQASNSYVYSQAEQPDPYLAQTRYVPPSPANQLSSPTAPLSPPSSPPSPSPPPSESQSESQYSAPNRFNSKFYNNSSLPRNTVIDTDALITPASSATTNSEPTRTSQEELRRTLEDLSFE